jgi:hypothetical protein
MEPTDSQTLPSETASLLGTVPAVTSHRCFSTEPINIGLQEHVLAVPDWTYRVAANTLHLWAERFNLEFKLGLPTPAKSPLRTFDGPSPI